MLLGVYKQCAILLVAIAILLSSCADNNQPQAEVPPQEVTDVAVTPETPEVAAELPRLVGKATVEMVVKGEKIVIEVDGTQAPVTAGNFVDLVERGVYDGTTFHRVVREPQPFVVQGGDPQSKDATVPVEQLGTGSFNDPETNEPRYVPLEITPAGADRPVYSRTFEMAGIAEAPALSHTRGAVAMARSQFPDSASAQFYFALTDLPFLDGNYAVFGYVTDGLAVIDEIQQGDLIESATVVEGLENLQTAAGEPAATEESATEESVTEESATEESATEESATEAPVGE